jgi:hypothetical protein
VRSPKSPLDQENAITQQASHTLLDRGPTWGALRGASVQVQFCENVGHSGKTLKARGEIPDLSARVCDDRVFFVL